MLLTFFAFVLGLAIGRYIIPNMNEVKYVPEYSDSFKKSISETEQRLNKEIANSMNKAIAKACTEAPEITEVPETVPVAKTNKKNGRSKHLMTTDKE